MAKPFVRSARADRLGGVAVRLGVAPKPLHVLTTRGHRSGQERASPVNVVEHEESRWIVALDGDAGWIRNARADGHATISRRGRTEAVTLAEAPAAEISAAIKRYVTTLGYNRKYFDHGPDDAVEAFVAEVEGHPVFQVRSD